MSQSTTDLANLFGVALNAVSSNRGQLNSMDEANHPNHGDNAAHNLGLIQSALQSQQSQNPSDALRLAAQTLNTQGRGSTAPQYAQGLQQAATHFQGQQNLSNDDVGLLMHSMLGASTGNQAAPQSTQMAGMLSGQTQQAAPGGNDLVSKLASSHGIHAHQSVWFKHAVRCYASCYASYDGRQPTPSILSRRSFRRPYCPEYHEVVNGLVEIKPQDPRTK